MQRIMSGLSEERKKERKKMEGAGTLDSGKEGQIEEITTEWGERWVKNIERAWEARSVR